MWTAVSRHCHNVYVDFNVKIGNSARNDVTSLFIPSKQG